MWELDYKESWVLKNWCFWTVALEKTLESPLDCKEIKPINPKGYQSWIFIGRTDAEAETPVLWSPDAKNWLTGKDPVAGKDWRQEEKGTPDDEMVGWHHWLDGHEFEQAPEVDDGQGSLVCCSPRGCKELNMTEQLNWFDTTWRYSTTSKGLLPVGNWMGEVRGFNYICDALFKNSSDANMENVNNCWFLEVFSIKHMVRRFDFSSSLDMFSFPSGMFVMSKKESDEMVIGVCCLVTKSCPTLCDPMDCSIPGFPVLHYLLECPRGSYHWVGDVNQPSHPLSPPSPPALNLSVLYKPLFLQVSVWLIKQRILLVTHRRVRAYGVHSWSDGYGKTKGLSSSCLMALPFLGIALILTVQDGAWLSITSCCSYFFDQNLVTWVHLAVKETEKCCLYSTQPCIVATKIRISILIE